MLIDTHSHLYCEEFDQDRTEVLKRAREVGIDRIVLPNIDSSSLERMLTLCKQYPDLCFPAIGVHPTSITTDNLDYELSIVKKQLETPNNPFIAIGEIGLDLYWDRTYMDEQIQALQQQLQWAIEYHLPVIIHCREAWDKLLECMTPYNKGGLRGIFHSFTADEKNAQKALMFENFMIGINGVVTFKNSTLPQVLQTIPLSKIVLETDAPYLSPVPNRGKRNESANLTHTLKRIAEIYQATEDEIKKKTTENALSLFQWSKISQERF